MNLENLKVGMEVKDYKVMCSLVKEKVKTGKSKQLQLKKWKRFFEWHNEGRMFVIDEIYSKPKEKIDLRGKTEASLYNNRAEYVEEIELLILDLLSQAEWKESGEGVLIGKAQLFKTLNMINDNYYKYRNKKIELKEMLNIRKETIDDFYNSTSAMLERNIESALTNLRRNSLIIWTKRIAVNKILKENEEKGDWTLLLPTTATDEEEELILKAEKEVLEIFAEKYEIDISKAKWQEKVKRLLFVHEEYDEYKEKVNGILREKSNIYNYFNAYNINFDLSVVTEAKEQYKLSLENKKTKKTEINKGIKDRISKNAEKRTIRAKENPTEENKHRKFKKYKNDINKVSKTLIDENTKEI